MRRALLIASALPLGAAAAIVVPAFASNADVTATPANTFNPKTVTIDAGDKVRWTEGGGGHNVAFAGEASNKLPYEREFPSAGEFKYYCTIHAPGPDGPGMTGVVNVVPKASPSPSPTASASPSPSATASPSPTATATPTATVIADPPASTFTARAAASSFCVRKGRLCRRPGVRIALDVTPNGVSSKSSVTLSGELTKGGRKVGQFRYRARKGKSTMTFTRTNGPVGRTLTAGSYALKLSANDGLGARARTVRFKIR